MTNLENQLASKRTRIFWLTSQHHYPFGMMMPTRTWDAESSYRFGFQGQERDDEIKGAGNSLNYTYRMHDPRLGRFFAVDPLAPKYPHNSPFAFSENRVIDGIELEGLEVISYETLFDITKQKREVVNWKFVDGRNKYIITHNTIIQGWFQENGTFVRDNTISIDEEKSIDYNYLSKMPIKTPDFQITPNDKTLINRTNPKDLDGFAFSVEFTSGYLDYTDFFNSDNTVNDSRTRELNNAIDSFNKFSKKESGSFQVWIGDSVSDEDFAAKSESIRSYLIEAGIDEKNIDIQKNDEEGAMPLQYMGVNGE